MSKHMDEGRLLCETCGYDLDGLDLESACPECGRLVAESHASHRKGSPWQKRPGLISWWHTNYSALRRPGELFASIRLEPRTGRWLAWLNITTAALIMVAPWTGTLIGDPIRTARGSGPLAELLTFTWFFPAQIAAITAVLYTMTLIEYHAIRFIAARRGWRLTRAAAWQVCAHATVGWIILGIAPVFAMAAVYVMRVVLAWPLGRQLDLRVYGLGHTSISTILSWLLPLIAIIAGVFVYELLVYLGVRKCRYAAAVIVPPVPTRLLL